jgi:hypothetical protein
MFNIWSQELIRRALIKNIEKPTKANFPPW